MPSPFPGMNPYLERATAWESFHPNFIATAFEHIAAQLPPEYIVRIENRVYIHEPPLDDRRFIGRSDLAVGRAPRRGAGRRRRTTPSCRPPCRSRSGWARTW